MEDKDLMIENILDKPAIKKKVDGKAKGDRTELHLCKLLSKHFGEEFSKAPGSGSRWSQVAYLPEHAKKTLSGDVCVPEEFLWVIESKGGYEDDIDLNNICDGKISRLDEFIEQSSRDAAYCNRKPMICWKRNRKPWLCMVLEKDLSVVGLQNLPYHICYREWIIVTLEELLEKTERKFWYNIKGAANE